VIGRRQVQFRDNNIKNVIAFMTSEFGYPIYTKVESILRDKFYDYAYDVWKDYAMDELCPQTMRPIFIMSWKNVQRYCALLFGICEELEKIFTQEQLISSYYRSKEGDTQIFKRLAVYILNLFIFRNRMVIKETSVLHFAEEVSNYVQPFSH
jgi:hypothetical protein